MYPLYQDASTVLELMEKRKGTANRLSLSTSIRNKKACLAVAAETSRYANVLQECMEAAGIDQQQHEFKPWLIKVLVYELLLGNKKITGGGACDVYSPALQRFQVRARAAFRLVPIGL